MKPLILKKYHFLRWTFVFKPNLLNISNNKMVNIFVSKHDSTIWEYVLVGKKAKKFLSKYHMKALCAAWHDLRSCHFNWANNCLLILLSSSQVYAAYYYGMYHQLRSGSAELGNSNPFFEERVNKHTQTITMAVLWHKAHAFTNVCGSFFVPKKY